MPDEQPAYPGIKSRPSALLAMGISLWLGGFHVHDLWTHRSPRPDWMDEFHAVLPSYTWITLHILGFCIMVFVLANVVRECRGAERIYFVMFLGSLLIEPFHDSSHDRALRAGGSRPGDAARLSLAPHHRQTTRRRF